MRPARSFRHLPSRVTWPRALPSLGRAARPGTPPAAQLRHAAPPATLSPPVSLWEPLRENVPVRGPVAGLVRRAASRLRYPWLLVLTGTLFVVDLFVPDVIPFFDEALLGLVTLLLATRRRAKSNAPPP